MSFIDSIAPIAVAVGDLFLPRFCRVCGSRLGRFERHLCLSCMADLPLSYNWLQEHNPVADRYNDVIQRQLQKGFASRAGLPEGESSEFRSEITGLRPYEYALSLLVYRGDSPYSHIPKALKYGADFSLGRSFARHLAAAVKQARFLADASLVVPVPLHWARRFRRGYNQAEVIARQLSAELGLPCRPGVLRRCRRTRTQTRLDIEHKAANVSGAFKADLRCLARILKELGLPLSEAAEREAAVSALHIILVDDVFTTGGTMAACHAALSRGLESLGFRPGTFRISAVTLAAV